MNFKDGQPIYVQIAERLSDEVLAGTYLPGGRAPSAREYAALLEVNVNTIVKAFDLLAQRGVLHVRRGMGYYVADEACSLILEARRAYFRTHTLPDFVRQLRQLGISLDDVARAYDAYNEQHPAGGPD